MFEKAVKLFVKGNHFEKTLGATLSVQTPGEISYELTIEEKHLSSPSTAHGGVLAALMDSILGVAALTHAFTRNHICSTIEFKINYLRPVKLGDVLTGKGRVVHKGNRIVVSQGEIHRPGKSGNEVVASGLGTFNLYPMEKSAFHELLGEDEV